MITSSTIELDGYLAMPGIDGESRRAGHEDEIEVHRIAWRIEQDAPGSAGSGRRRRWVEVGPLIVHTWYDASSPYLALAALEGRHFDEVVLTLRRDTGDEPIDYLRLTMSDVVIASYELLDEHATSATVVDRVPERLGLTFVEIAIRYLEQLDDGGHKKHEVEYDTAGGT